MLNATGKPGVAAKAAAQLKALGFKIAGVATAPNVQANTVVRYDPGFDESGRTLTAAVKGATSKMEASLGTTLVLYVGTDYTGVQKVTVPAAVALPYTAVVQTAADDSCF